MNYSDPFGLCTSDETEKITFEKNEDGDWVANRSCLHSSGRWVTDWTGIFGHQTLINALYGVGNRVAGLESVMNAYGEVTGINGLGRGVDDLLNGNYLAGGIQLALALPIVPEGRIASEANVTFQAAHAARHLEGLGITHEAVRSAIMTQVGGVAQGAHFGWVEVEGYWLQYRFNEWAPGRYNVGTYFPVSGPLLRR